MNPGVRQLLMGGRRRAGVLPAEAYRADTTTASLSIATYDGGNELVHPSVWDSGAIWNGYRYWMAATPYFASNTALENPCIYASNDLETWVVPGALVNPIDAAPVAPAYNSDTHLAMGTGGYLYCFYREYDTANVGSEERIYYRRSLDGVTWGAQTLSLSNDQTVARYVSPAIEWDGVQWVMYTVDIVPSPNNVVRLTANSVNGPWSSPRVCAITMATGREAWHLDAKYYQGFWYLLLQDTPTGGSSGGSLYLCKSMQDHLTFERPTTPVLSFLGDWHALIYRSCLIPKLVSGQLAFDLMYTGVSAGGNYHLAHTQILPFDVSNYSAEPARAIAGATAGTAPFLIGDDFNRANGALGTSTGTEVWTISAGTPNVISNKAGGTLVENARAYLEAGSANAYIEAELSGHVTTDQTWMIFRFSDANNFWRIGFNATAFSLQKVVAGAATTMASGSILIMGTPTVSRIGVICNGSDITVKVEGRRWLTITDAFNSTATKAGIQVNNTSSRIDNFYARSLVGGA